MALTWDQVLAWRMRRQLLDPAIALDAVDVTTRICGVQAQVASAAELGVAVRQRQGRMGEVGRALADGALMKTWAMRGTLHVLEPAEAGAYLALIGSLRVWETPRWQRAFRVTPADMDALVDAVGRALEGRILTREELIEEVVALTGRRHLEEELHSGWGALLKPLAWMGLLCQGPIQGTRVTFTRPDTWLPKWPGVPEPADAARVALPRYLAAHGPATMKAFDAWLTRGAARKRDLTSWFDAVADQLVSVDVEGDDCLLLAGDLAELESTAPSNAVRLLPAFDQFLLGPGTADPRVVPPSRRREVSRAAGWIAPVVLAGGRVAGVWEVDGDSVTVRLFEEAGPIDAGALPAEVGRLAQILGRELEMAVSTSS